MFAKIKTEFNNAPIATMGVILGLVISWLAIDSSTEADQSDLKINDLNSPTVTPEVKPELITKVIDEPKNYQETTTQKSEQKNSDLSESPRNYIEIMGFVDINSNFFELGISDNAYNLIDGNINTTVKFPSQKRTLQAKFSLTFAEPIDIQYIGIGQPSSDYQLNLSKIKIRAQYVDKHWGEWVEYKIEPSKGEARFNFSAPQQVSALEFNPIGSVNKFRATELGDVSVYRY